MINNVWVSYREEPKEAFVGCRYLDKEQKKIFQFDGNEWSSIDVIGNFGIVSVMTPPCAYYVTPEKELKKATKKDLKRMGLI